MSIKQGRVLYYELTSKSYEKTFNPISTKPQHNDVKSILKRIIISGMFEDDSEFLNKIRDDIPLIHDELFYLYDTLTFKPCCTIQTLMQTMVFILYKLHYFKYEPQNMAVIIDNPPLLQHYLYGSKSPLLSTTSMYANAYCNHLSINATVFVRRCSKIIADIRKTKYIFNEFVRAFQFQ